jgi:hypothetical protein
VQTLLDQREERQRTENLAMQENLAALTEYIRRFDVQRRVDLRQVEDRLWRIEDATAGQLEQHRNAIDYMVRASLTGTAAR